MDWGLGHVDDPNAVTKDFVREILAKCMPLEVYLAPEDNLERKFKKVGHGQGGFIRLEPIQQSPGGSTDTIFSVYPVTAKHNFRQVRDLKGTNHVPCLANFRIPNSTIEIETQDMGWVPNPAVDTFDLRKGKEGRPALTGYGFDMSVGTLIADSDNPVTHERASFRKVGPRFVIKKGLKVGIAVMFPKDAEPTQYTIAGAFEDRVDITDVEIKRIYGTHSQINIYTGEILYVGEDHIEYNINSFTGCSGAIVFLLDKQPDELDIDIADYGKAVAVHSGSHPTLMGRNYGFIIDRHPSMDYSY